MQLISVTFFAIAISLAANFSACGADLEGQASVIDGDTLEIHGTRIRVFGIDAPRLISFAATKIATCTAADRKHPTLFDFIARRPVECVEVDRDRYKRAVSVCTVGGTDIADWACSKRTGARLAAV
jgi:endonuclease YncB( thermonuclease family)